MEQRRKVEVSEFFIVFAQEMGLLLFPEVLDDQLLQQLLSLLLSPYILRKQVVVHREHRAVMLRLLKINFVIWFQSYILESLCFFHLNLVKLLQLVDIIFVTADVFLLSLLDRLDVVGEKGQTAWLERARAQIVVRGRRRLFRAELESLHLLGDLLRLALRICAAAGGFHHDLAGGVA